MKKLMTISLVALFVLATSGLFAQMLPSKLLTNIAPNPPTMGAPTSCLPCAIPENEPPIGWDGIDVTNGGCLETPNLFSNINIGEVYCSNVNTYLYLGIGANTSTDLDWYKVILTSPQTLYWTVDAPIYGQTYILGPPCSDFAQYAGVYSTPGVTTISAPLPAGTYYLVFGSSAYYGDGANFQYQATVTTAPPGVPATWCPAPIPTLTEWGLIILGLSLLGFGTIYLLRRG